MSKTTTAMGLSSPFGGSECRSDGRVDGAPAKPPTGEVTTQDVHGSQFAQLAAGMLEVSADQHLNRRARRETQLTGNHGEGR